MNEGTSLFKRKFANIRKVGTHSMKSINGTFRDTSSYRSLEETRLDNSTTFYQPVGDISRLTGVHPSDENIVADESDILRNIEFDASDLNAFIVRSVSEDFLSKKILYQSNLSFVNDIVRNKEIKLVRSVLIAIERREVELHALKNQLRRLQSEFSHRKTMTSNNDLAKTTDIINSVRENTIKTTERIENWAKFVSSAWATTGDVSHRYMTAVESTAGKDYCVIVTTNSELLYNASRPMHSNIVRYCRGPEPSKHIHNIRLVGVYSTKVEAMEAFNQAMNESQNDDVGKLKQDPRMLISIRPCKKHILISSAGVPRSMPCETCTARHFEASFEVKGNVNQNLKYPKFIWCGQNYIDKIWNDMTQLEGNMMLKTIFTDTSFRANPLLLTEDSSAFIMPTAGLAPVQLADTHADVYSYLMNTSQLQQQGKKDLVKKRYWDRLENALKILTTCSLRPSTTTHSLESDMAEVTGLRESKSTSNLLRSEIFYSHHGLSLSVTAERQKHSYRVKGIWCRSDRGEFAGLRKGRHARHFQYQNDLLIKGRKKRKQVQDMTEKIRACIALGVGNVQPEDIEALIEEARLLQDDTLELDIIQAEKHLLLSRMTEDIARLCQRLYRGHVGRRIARQVLEEKIERERRFRIRNEVTVATAASFVSSVLKQCVLALRHTIQKPFLTRGVTYSGTTCIVSISSRSSDLRKPINDVCMSCQTKSSSSKFNIVKQGQEAARPPCTCNLFKNQEEWLVESYDPISRNRLTNYLSLEYVDFCLRQNLRDRALWLNVKSMNLESSKQFIAPSTNSHSRNVDVIARIQAKFQNQYGSYFYREYDDNIASALTRATNQRSIHLRKSIWKNPDKIIDIKQSPELWKPNEKWEPLSSFHVLIQERADLQQVISELELTCQHYREMSNDRNEEKLAYEAILDMNYMLYEDALATYLKLVDQLEVATLRIRTVMNYSLETIIIATQEELGIIEDWKQSWDDFENGNAWGKSKVNM